MKPEVRWPLFIVSLLVLQVLLGVFFVWKATSDPSFAVEEDYYQKAVNWEAAQAQTQHNQTLGWEITQTFSPPPVVGADPTLSVVLTDAVGTPISGASLDVETFHNVRAGHILRATLVEQGAGVYEARLPMFRPGLWEMRYTVNHSGETFTSVSKTHLEAGGR